MSQAGIINVIENNPTIPIYFEGDSGFAVALFNVINIKGTGGIVTSAAGNTITIDGSEIAPNLTITGTTGGPLGPTADNWNLLAGVIAAGTTPVQVNGAVSTFTINLQRAQASATTAANIVGLSSFNSASFSVDANGYVSFTGAVGAESFAVDAHTAPGTSPVVPNAGVITVTGGQVAAGTIANVIRTNSLAANTYTIQIQRSQAVASSTVGDNGVSHFDSSKFTVDANGFVSLVSTAIAQTLTGNTGGAVSPTAGNINVVTANSSVKFAGTTSTLTLDFGLSNILLGAVGNISSGIQNVSLGMQALQVVSSGGANTAIGFNALPSLTTGNNNTFVGLNTGSVLSSSSNNTAVGVGALINLATGTGFNVALGYIALSGLSTGTMNIGLGIGAGNAYTGAEASNICIQNAGVLGESNTIRIGTPGSSSGQQNRAFMAGISGVTVSSSNPVGINASGQLSDLGPSSSSQPPIGALEYFSTNGTAGATYPNPQWLICDGSTYSQATYTTLFARLGLLNNGGTTWSPRNGATTTVNTLLYGGGLYLEGTSTGVVWTSTDTNTWTSRTTGGSNIVAGLGYNGSVYALIQSNTPVFVASATDAITWTRRVVPTNVSFNTMTWGNGLFVAASSVGPIMTSTDGTTWSSKMPSIGTTAGITQGYRPYILGGGVYVASSANGVISSSTDNINFIGRNSNSTSVSISNLLFANSKYVASGNSGFISTSTDATTWVTQSSGSSSALTGLTYSSSGGFVYVGFGGAISSSTDAVTWVARTSGTTSSINAVIYGTAYVAGGNLGYVGSSTDAITWTTRTSATTSTIYALGFGNGLHVYCGSLGALGTSTDGTTWTARTSFYTASMFSVAYGVGQYVMCGAGGLIQTSTDAITWVSRTSATSSTLYSVFFDGTAFQAGGTQTLVTSTDGITWTLRNDNSRVIQGSAYGNGLYLLTANGGIVYTSTDTNVWTSRATAVTQTLFDIVYGNQFVAVGSNGSITTSTDTITWITASIGSNPTLSAIAFASGVYAVAVGTTAGVTYTSPDSIVWTSTAIGSGMTSNDMVAGNGLFVVGGQISGGGATYASLSTYAYNPATQFQVPTALADSLVSQNATANFKRNLFIRAL